MTSMYYSEASLDDVDFASLASPPPRHPSHPRACSECGSSAEPPDVHDESDDNLDDDDSDTSLSTTGNYSPPAWRRLENGDRWYGSWRDGNDVLVRRALNKSLPFYPQFDPEIFEAARRTRLPTGSLSPEKGRSPEPDIRVDDDSLAKRKTRSPTPVKQEADGDSTEKQRHRSTTASMSPSPSKDNCRCRLLVSCFLYANYMFQTFDSRCGPTFNNELSLSMLQSASFRQAIAP